MKSSNFKILLIDSNPSICETLSVALKAEGFAVLVSLFSLDAISMAKTELPDIILVDLLMPELDGIEICIELKNEPKLANTLIAFYSERKEDYSQIAAFNAGADDYIIKPMKPRVIVSRINALLKRHINSSPPVSGNSIGLTIDREKYLIFKDGEKISLPPKEFELLSLLFSSPEKVFTRKEISALIWGHEILTDNRTIDVHVRKLRSKLGNNYIKTLKGIGYSFEPEFL